jgi:hypothetical protein
LADSYRRCFPVHHLHEHLARHGRGLFQCGIRKVDAAFGHLRQVVRQQHCTVYKSTSPEDACLLAAAFFGEEIFIISRQVDYAMSCGRPAFVWSAK